MGELTSKYRPEKSSDSEFLDIPLFRRAWLGGAFEAGGGIYFGIRTGRSQVTTHVDISDNDPTVPRRLYEEFGGSFRHRPETKSFRWVIHGHKASQIAISMDSFAPSRKKIIDLIRQLEQNANEQVDTVKQFREDKTVSFQTKTEYTGLLKIPEFVAGIIDARGSVSPRVDSHRPQPRLKVQTTNRPLIEALIEEFGGERYLSCPAGSIVVIEGKQYEIKKDKINWTLGITETAWLYQFVKPHLLGGKIKGYQP